jgi:hypothetical protein
MFNYKYIKYRTKYERLLKQLGGGDVIGFTCKKESKAKYLCGTEKVICDKIEKKFDLVGRCELKEDDANCLTKFKKRDKADYYCEKIPDGIYLSDNDTKSLLETLNEPTNYENGKIKEDPFKIIIEILQNNPYVSNYRVKLDKATKLLSTPEPDKRDDINTTNILLYLTHLAKVTPKQLEELLKGTSDIDFLQLDRAIWSGYEVNMDNNIILNMIAIGNQPDNITTDYDESLEKVLDMLSKKPLAYRKEVLSHLDKFPGGAHTALGFLIRAGKLKLARKVLDMGAPVIHPDPKLSADILRMAALNIYTTLPSYIDRASVEVINKVKQFEEKLTEDIFKQAVKECKEFKDGCFSQTSKDAIIKGLTDTNDINIFTSEYRTQKLIILLKNAKIRKPKNKKNKDCIKRLTDLMNQINANKSNDKEYRS